MSGDQQHDAGVVGVGALAADDPRRPDDAPRRRSDLLLLPHRHDPHRDMSLGRPALRPGRPRRADRQAETRRAHPSTRCTSAPGSPSTWSAWKCVRTMRSSARTSSRRRQRSTALGSGPASTSTAWCGAVATTSASPWPTSHATISHPGGGHGCLGPHGERATRARATHAAIAGGRRRSLGAATHPAMLRTPSSNAPVQPSGHGAVACGALAQVCATATIQATGTPARCAMTAASGGDTGAASAVMTPRIVAGATAGAARRFATTAIRLTFPESSTMTGAHTS